jgi:hypothetical protein
MRGLMLGFCAALVLSGCGDSDDGNAAQLIEDARSLYRGHVSQKLDKASVSNCVDVLEDASRRLKEAHELYPNALIVTASETKTLEGQVAERLGTCRQIKQQQGW